MRRKQNGSRVHLGVGLHQTDLYIWEVQGIGKQGRTENSKLVQKGREGRKGGHGEGLSRGHKVAEAQ